MSDAGKSPRSSPKPAKTKPARSNKTSTKVLAANSNSSQQDEAERNSPGDDSPDAPPPTKSVAPQSRSHTPGHLSSKSINPQQPKPSDLPIRKRSQSASQAASNSASSTYVASLPPISSSADPPSESHQNEHHENEQKQPPASEASSSLGRQRKTVPTAAAARRTHKLTKPPEGQHVPFPPLPDSASAPNVELAPASGMYWSKAFVSGSPHASMRAHTATLIGSNVYIFGGCDAKTCFNTLYVLDADAFYWSVPHVVGEFPLPLRAMTCTAVGRRLVVFGGGDGPEYYNDVYVLDTLNFRWTRPRIVGDKIPSKRRAHTACLYRMGIYVFGGGDGVKALNDIWRLDVSDSTKMSWKLISAPGKAASSSSGKEAYPKARGYHTANMVGSKLIVFGGSDGGECFDDVWIYDVETHVWKAVSMSVTYRRLSHTATIVGSYLFVLGGHDGNDYCNDVLLLNLVTMAWETRKVYGQPPSERGYHGTVLHDSRLLVIGGFDGSEVYGDVSILELAVHAYYSQISHFTIDV